MNTIINNKIMKTSSLSPYIFKDKITIKICALAVWSEQETHENVFITPLYFYSKKSRKDLRIGRREYPPSEAAGGTIEKIRSMIFGMKIF